MSINAGRSREKSSVSAEEAASLKDHEFPEEMRLEHDQSHGDISLLPVRWR
ncbi:MAG TPA: hypothetical protein VKQ28_08815 [Candidatus Acidoferrum sp.]|nr:hypothetical protein [Candidatus Acidoferrum sp.]